MYYVIVTSESRRILHWGADLTFPSSPYKVAEFAEAEAGIRWINIFIRGFISSVNSQILVLEENIANDCPTLFCFPSSV